ncbi:hypothetical protein AJ79_05005 [Helicocarpus griseus UAMH5409]|uniref:EKC/KEOPS complex subunit BUD32 n=1 Tax=Helicocarpus griseus UAMH5409 TaxID=1447875 RepID=A0A2B7XQL9_9EURO|nr:hypothetical protein AJ79_05005 [Helicocarpus griseus UAMH5409]
MTVWVFDRSGCYSPGQFNIHNEPQRSIQLIADYMMMDEELGLDTFMERDGDIRILSPINGRLSAVERLAISQRFQSSDWSHVVKFSWTSDRRKPEADLLKLANQRGVKGIARLVGHRSVTSIKDMRSSITFTKPYNFGGTFSAASLFSQRFQSQSLSVLSLFSELHGLNIAERNILHRDISENNIIITNPTNTGFAGMLINLDLAKELGTGRSGARCRTGTMEFMAIQVLRNIDHTYVLLRFALAVRSPRLGVCRQSKKPADAESTDEVVYRELL